jgi:acetyltransferase-like isoleucine patch superfamily enzyme
MIGGGAVVVSDIPPYALAVGCPARVIKYNTPAVVAHSAIAS